MAILDKFKKKTFMVKTALGYVTYYFETLASIVKMADGRNVEDCINELNSKLEIKKYIASDIGLNTSVWQVLHWDCRKSADGKVSINVEIYTSATIVASNLYTIATNMLSEIRPNGFRAINAIAFNSSFGNTIACTAFIESGKIKLSIPNTGRPYVWLSGEYYI